VPAQKDGILISAPNVTIDLNGFNITGSAATDRSSPVYGIHSVAGSVKLSVRNGAISGFNAGFYLQPLSTTVVDEIAILLGGTTDFGVIDEQLGSNGIVHHLTAAGKFVRGLCPMVISESVASIFAMNGALGQCTYHAVSGKMI